MAVMAASVRVVATALTHQGAVRTNQEDAIAFADWVRSAPMDRPETLARDQAPPIIALVADGMGGHAAGEVASRTVAEVLGREAGRAVDAVGVAQLLAIANGDLFELMRARPALHGMGTTVAGIVIGADDAWVFNVGDSRIYRLDDRQLVQLSTDDTPGPKLADGRTAAVNSHLLTQSIGGGYEAAEIEPHVLREPLIAGTRYLICSDGLTDMVARPELEALVSDDDQLTVGAMFAAAMARGGRDNISILLIRLGAPA